MKVYVGLSGGVDSAVSAALLKKQGHDVTGVFIRGWSPPGFPCTEKEDRQDAMRVAGHLGIPFRTYDAIDVYKKRVAEKMVEGYGQGIVPNPDILCNSEIKFGVFYDWALREGADAVATGHYAQIKDGKLLRGIDASKDQSYFVYSVRKDQFPHICFPIGGYTKDEVRVIAQKLHLPVAEKKDSQGLCFLGDIDFIAFLKEELGVRVGDVLNEKGETIGTHDGVHLYTLGARHGFTITEKNTERTPYYVVDKNINNNTLTVAKKENLKEYADTTVVIGNVTFVSSLSGTLSAQYRYHGILVPCTVEKRGDTYEVSFTESLPEPISKGQTIVLYDGDEVRGGGIVL